MRTITKAAALAGATIFMTASAATAAITIDENGNGFVGKGDVQLAYGFNNKQLQDFVKANPTGTFNLSRSVTVPVTSSVDETGTQAGTQSATQAGGQVGTESVTQSVTEVLSCTIVTGGVNNPVRFHREGTRTGERTATRTGSRTGSREGTRSAARSYTRTGSRSGTQTGTAAYTAAYDPRKNSNGKDGDVTGFWLTNVAINGTPALSDPVWGDEVSGTWVPGSWSASGAFSFGAYQWDSWDFADAQLTLGQTVWGDWVSEPGANPDSCLQGGNSGNVQGLENVVQEGEITGSGTVVPGLVTDGLVTEGGFTESGDPVSTGKTYGATQQGTPVYGAFNVVP